MSMNLACSVVSLPQISTWESRLIFSPNQYGGPDGGGEGVARRYVFWCRAQQQRQFNEAVNNSEDQAASDAIWNLRIAEMEQALSTAKLDRRHLMFRID